MTPQKSHDTIDNMTKKDTINPYFYCYKKAIGRPTTHEPGDNIPYMAWIQSKWRQFEKEEKGTPENAYHRPSRAPYRNEFTEWLQTRYGKENQ